MQASPDANRLHITLLGRRNAGKSTLFNALLGQEAALVSPVAGTTTDPVRRAAELWPLGPVLFVDTAGLDDEGALGALRIDKTLEMAERTDLILWVLRPDEEPELPSELTDTPLILVYNSDSSKPPKNEPPSRLPAVTVNALTGEGLDILREAIVVHAPARSEPDTIAAHLIQKGDCVLLVAPQDIQAPRGRLILPQQQTLRDLLDGGAIVTTICLPQYEHALNLLAAPPALIITDSQVFGPVHAKCPPTSRLTSFSILMARYKGDIELFIRGAAAIDTLSPGDKVLIAEACSHNPLDGDIGREKIPKMLEKKVGGSLDITVTAGNDFPRDVTPYKLAIHCGGCMITRRHVLSRVKRCRDAGIPVTNYGVAIAQMQGILDKVVY